jgi:hypothetical protein
MAFFILASLALADRKSYFLCGLVASMAVFSKQLAVMPTFALALLVLLTLQWRLISRFASGFIFGFLTILSPFILTGTLPAYFKAQGLASVHTMMSAQNPNVPWLIGLIARISKFGFLDGRTYSAVPIRIEEDALRQFLYLGFGVITVLVIVAWFFYWTCLNKTKDISALSAGVFAIVTYNLFNFGVHENHVFMVLPALFALTSNPRMRKAYFLTSTALALNLLATGGLGRSIDTFPLLTQSSGELYTFLSAVCMVLYLIAFIDLALTRPINPAHGKMPTRL